jgi:hypothetical protein
MRQRCDRVWLFSGEYSFQAGRQNLYSKKFQGEESHA